MAMARIRYPQRISLARLPTPLEPLQRLTPMTGPRIWIKRDDLSGFGLSGNKVRKLEFVLAEALSQGADTIITCGGLQSNHCRATAVACAQLGLHCELLLRGETTAVADGNLFIDQLCGATVHAIEPQRYRAQFEVLRDALLADLRERGRKPYFIPTGASDGIGIWGYIRAAEELLADMQQAGFRADAIVHATGSGGTQAGLLAGLHLLQEPIPVWGVNVCDDRAYFERKIAHDLADWRDRYGMAGSPDPATIRILEGYMGPGYGQVTAGLLDTLRQAACQEGLLLDPVYSGKAFQAVLGEIHGGGIFSGMGNIVFIHTGGFFGSPVYRDALLGPA